MAMRATRNLRLAFALRVSNVLSGSSHAAFAMPSRLKIASLGTALASFWRPFTTRPPAAKSRFRERPRSLPASGFDIIEAGRLIEEEELPDYRADRFYPVRLGDVFQERYQVLVKLGFGTSSTTWLARDLR